MNILRSILIAPLLLAAALALASPASAQTFSAFASPEHPFVEIPGQPGATSITVTVRPTLERSFMVVQLDPTFDGQGVVIFNAPGSFQRTIVRDPFGGIVATNQGNPFPVTVFVPDPGTPVSLFSSQLLGQTTQISTINKGYSTPTVVLPVQFQGNYITTFQSGFCRARETVHPVVEVTVTYH